MDGQGGPPLQRARGGNGPESDRRKNGLYMDRASSSTVARLSSYFRVLGEFDREHVETISSKRLAERCGITSAQVRKDLSVFGNFGRRGLGYNVSELQGEIGTILGLGRRWRVALIGAGNLGHALFAYREFQRQGSQQIRTQLMPGRAAQPSAPPDFANGMALFVALHPQTRSAISQVRRDA